MPGIAAQDWVSAFNTAIAAGAAVTTNGADTTLLPATSNVMVNPGTFARIGQMYRLRAAGKVSNIVTTPGTLTFKFWLGPTKNIAVFSSGALGLNVVAKSNVTWDMELNFQLITIGAGTAATLLTTGKWVSESVVGSPVPTAGGSGMLLLPASSPAAGTGFDSTVANQIDLTANFSLTGNSITCQTFSFEMLDN